MLGYQPTGRKAFGSLMAAGMLILGFFWLSNSAGPAGAQAGHVHQWTAYTAPTGEVQLAHLDGSPLDNAHPAQPCEVVMAGVFTMKDEDQCVAPGCNLPNGILLDLDCQVRNWKRVPQEVDLYFVREILNAHWEHAEQTGEDGDTWSNDSPMPQFIRVARLPKEFPPNDGSEIDGGAVRPRIDDDGGAGGYDDDPVWLDWAVLPVLGLKCYVPKGRSALARDCSVCSAASAQQGHSSITPLDGDVSFTVPVTSWAYRGEDIDFSLTYHSRSAQDPRANFNQTRHSRHTGSSHPQN